MDRSSSNVSTPTIAKIEERNNQLLLAQIQGNQSPYEKSFPSYTQSQDLSKIMKKPLHQREDFQEEVAIIQTNGDNNIQSSAGLY